MKIINPAIVKAQTLKLAEYEEKRAKMLDEYNKCIYERADPFTITKIHYRANSSRDATMRITIDHDPLNVMVYKKFRLKTLGFSEWLEVQALESKTSSKSNDLLLQILGAIEEEFHLATTTQLIRLQRSIQRGTPKAEEMFRKLELIIEARDDAAQARDIIKDNLDGLGQHIHLLLNELNCYPAVSIGYVNKFACKLDSLSSLLVQRPGTQDRGCGYSMWMDDLRLSLSSSSGPSTPPSSYPGPSTHPTYSPGPSGSTLNLGKAECSNCKFLAKKIKTLEEKIKILEAIVEMERHPENHTLESAAILHELYNDTGKLGLE
ncbi:hypothetical protein Tco_0272022 [Tanacetum coccineum]